MVGYSTIEKKEIPRQKEELPKEINSKNVIYYSEHYRKMEGATVKQKARLFVENKCIEYDPDGEKYEMKIPGDYEGHKFICKPIPGYNSTTYRLWHLKGQEFACSCQHYVRYKTMCSHILALWMQLKIWNWRRNDQSQKV